jgi:hypothetical protein
MSLVQRAHCGITDSPAPDAAVQSFMPEAAARIARDLTVAVRRFAGVRHVVSQFGSAGCSPH